MRGVELVPCESTAQAAKFARDDPQSGAVASIICSQLFGLVVLHEAIQDETSIQLIDPDNSTRFLVLGHKYTVPTGMDKTLLKFLVDSHAGALCDALSVMKEASLDLTKIDSRPSRIEPWCCFLTQALLFLH